MVDYFSMLKEYVKNNFIMTTYTEKTTNLSVTNILGYTINNNIRYLYEHYETFNLIWLDNEERYIGSINFVSYDKLDMEHNELFETMKECYDIEEDEQDIVKDILNWYPLIWFANGDAFCLDKRDGTIVFYEHEIYDGEKNLHSLLIATSLDELFEKWSKIHFADIYYWDEVVNDFGIDLSNDFLRNYF